MHCLPLVLTSLVALAFSATIDLDPEDDINEEEFAKYFHVEEEVSDAEKLRREEALVENEKIIKETNEEFLAGKIQWWDEVNKDSDLPPDEFLSEKTGAKIPNSGRGLLEPLEKRCGSCVAFSNMALVETCFLRLTGQVGDYSEQQFIDCGYGQNGAAGCDGAPPHAYVKWAADNVERGLLHEAVYPYTNTEPSLTCPDLPPYSQGAEVTDYYYTYSGDEETLAKLVFQHGAVVTSVNADGPFQSYGGGVFGGCTDNNTNHAVTVVGYGTEHGEDFWLIKNSWGSDWGEEGYIRLRRGVGMCGVGSTMVTLSCGPVSGPTDAPLTTRAPCEDKWSNCPSLAETSCYKPSIAEDCSRSCGMCPGLTPAPSVTCYDTFGNCQELAATNCHKWGPHCLKSCGLCEGLTPHSSNSCYDSYSNCADICPWYSGDQCNLACNRC